MTKVQLVYLASLQALHSNNFEAELHVPGQADLRLRADDF